MEGAEFLRMDKTVMSFGTLDDAPDEIAYWQTKTPQERIAAIELMRRTLYGYDPATSRLQRILEIAEYPPR